MGNSIVVHIDDAKWLTKQIPIPGDTRDRGSQFIGNLDKGPWIHIESLEPGHTTHPHSHNQDEVIYIIDGDLTFAERLCGPGTIIYVEHDTEYAFTVGNTGVRFMIVRPGLASATLNGEVINLKELYSKDQGNP